MEKTVLSCTATLLVFSLVLATMPEGIVSFASQECTYGSKVPCKHAQDCLTCKSPYITKCMEPDHICGCCIIPLNISNSNFV
ncbi:hypothetical protein Scep_025363 [Stephania cephalantha]|uniref:Uncharacterized protein n=1 Tax=Stephania cephalantha TaxID=152367 RepID=A0AAP0ES12_9MAGN